MREQKTLDPGLRFESDSRMTTALSVYLDLIRFGAAFIVLLHHSCFQKFGTLLPQRFASSGTEPVIVFFVLSGFVIAYTAEAKDRSLADYSASRLARLLSVVLPALLLTAILDGCGQRLDPALYADQWTDHETLANLAAPAWLRYATTAMFVNELWWLNLWPGTNSPFWSLGYEVGYYVLFGCAFYLRGWKRAALVVAGAVILGPKILLLLPTWLLGVLAWLVVKRYPISLRAGIWIFWSGVIGYILFIFTGTKRYLEYFVPLAIGAQNAEKLGLAVFAVSNFVTAVCFSLTIIGFIGIQPVLAGSLLRLRRIARALGQMTFSMYLFHYPLIYFFAAASTAAGLAWARPVTVLGGTSLAIYGLSRVTETQKDRWKQWLFRTCAYLSHAKLPTPRPKPG